MAGVLAQALLGGVAGGAKQVNDDWRDRITRSRDKALKQEVLTEQRTYDEGQAAIKRTQTKEDALWANDQTFELHKKQAQYDRDNKEKPQYMGLNEGQTGLVPLNPNDAGGYDGVPVFEVGKGFISQGKAASSTSGSSGTGTAAGKLTSKQVAFFDVDGNMIDNAYVIERGDGQFGTIRTGTDGNQYFVPVYSLPDSDPAPEPVSDQAFQELADNRNDPMFIAEFNKQYGEGAAEKALAALGNPEPKPEPEPAPTPSVEPLSQSLSTPTAQPGAATDMPAGSWSNVNLGIGDALKDTFSFNLDQNRLNAVRDFVKKNGRAPTPQELQEQYGIPAGVQVASQ